MKKEKLRLTKNGNSGANKGKSKSSGKKKYSVSRECKEGSHLRKRIMIKNDGRYLIYYDFYKIKNII